MAYRMLGLLLLSLACAAGCSDGSAGGSRGSGSSGGGGGTGGGAGLGGSGGAAGTGGAGPAACATSVLCQTCPDDPPCEVSDDCGDGRACVESGCEDLEGVPIKQCVFTGGGACNDDAMCAPFGRVCREVVGEGNRCVKLTPGCDTSFDCVYGFECESGTCVDRRVPCDLDEHCPKSHVCASTGSSSFCVRIHRDCAFDFDCADLAPKCVDVDGDARMECAGTFDPNDPESDACTNDQCGGEAPVCEVAAAGSTSDCGMYGPCDQPGDCVEGFSCVGLWPDGRKECVPDGGECDSLSDCPVRQVCASPRLGGAPTCQAGYQP